METRTRLARVTAKPPTLHSGTLQCPWNILDAIGKWPGNIGFHISYCSTRGNKTTLLLLPSALRTSVARLVVVLQQQSKLQQEGLDLGIGSCSQNLNAMDAIITSPKNADCSILGQLFQAPSPPRFLESAWQTVIQALSKTKKSQELPCWIAFDFCGSSHSA